MTGSPYVTPAGLLYGRDAQAAISSRNAGPLGGGPIAYSSVIIEEAASSGGQASLLNYAAFATADDEALQTGRRFIEAPRAPLGGLDYARPRIMGVINVTPDSFSDGGVFESAKAAIAHGETLVAAGADILDIGGESTRPGAQPISADEELRRIEPVIAGLAGAGRRISVDTRKADVMRQAVAAGAAIINDVSALTFDETSLATIATLDVPVILMHAKGDPQTMQADPRYGDVRHEVFDALRARIAACLAAGIARERLCVDPGLGFGKTFAHNLELLQGLPLFAGLGVPLLVGASRKGFIGWLTGEAAPDQRQAGSVAAALMAVARGAHIVRVHDVRETAQALAVWQAISGGQRPD